MLGRRASVCGAVADGVAPEVAQIYSVQATSDNIDLKNLTPQSTTRATGVAMIWKKKIERTPVELLVKSTCDSHMKNTTTAALEIQRLARRLKRSELTKLTASIAI